MKIWELEVGKLYRRGNFLYSINEEGLLFCGKVFNDVLTESSMNYNRVLTAHFEEVVREIDWNKVPQGTKVQVRDNEYSSWANRYFITAYKDHKYSCECTSMKENDEYIGTDIMDFSCGWKFCRLHESVQVEEGWYK